MENIRNQYLLPLSVILKSLEDKERAQQAKQYLRNQFEFFGIMATQRREAYKLFFKEYKLPEAAIFPDIIHELWNLPEREYQYFGMELLEKFVKKSGKEIIAEIEFTVTNKSWWDTIDMIATHCAGDYFKKFPDEILPITKKWMDSENFWLQRTALLFQLKYKKNTDTSLFEEYIPRLLSSNEFFIQKAIGWVLREYSKTNAQYVIKFIENHQLKPLSQREAMKWINKNE